MNKLFLLVFLTIGCFSLNAQSTNYQPENEGWLLKIDEAYAESERTGKPIMANFTGSDWCGWCKRLTASVFSKPEFKAWAADNVVLLELDYPKRKQLPKDLRDQNAQLQQAFKVTGYPTVWVFNLDKDPTSGQFMIEGLGKTGYTKTVKEFTDACDKMIAQGN